MNFNQPCELNAYDFLIFTRILHIINKNIFTDSQSARDNKHCKVLKRRAIKNQF